MIFRLMLIGSTLFVLGAVQTVKADATADVQQKIQAIYDAQDTAILARDIDKTMVPYATDAVFINDVTGKETAGLDPVRRGWLDLFQLPRTTLTAAAHLTKEVTLDKTQKSVTVLTLEKITMSVINRAGKAAVVEVDETTRHYWVNGDAGWKIEQERIISVDSLRDGKLVRHNHKPVSP